MAARSFGVHHRLNAPRSRWRWDTSRSRRGWPSFPDPPVAHGTAAYRPAIDAFDRTDGCRSAAAAAADASASASVDGSINLGDNEVVLDMSRDVVVEIAMEESAAAAVHAPEAARISGCHRSVMGSAESTHDVGAMVKPGHRTKLEPQKCEDGTMTIDLRRVAIFAGLSDEQARALEAASGRQTFREGDVIVRQGDPGGRLFTIVSGQVAVSLPSDARPDMRLSILGAGEVFGEMSIFDDQPRSATVRALAPTEVLTLNREQVVAFFAAHPEAAIEIIRVLSRRLRDTNQLAERAPVARRAKVA